MNMTIHRWATFLLAGVVLGLFHFLGCSQPRMLEQDWEATQSRLEEFEADAVGLNATMNERFRRVNARIREHLAGHCACVNCGKITILNPSVMELSEIRSERIWP